MLCYFGWRPVRYKHSLNHMIELKKWLWCVTSSFKCRSWSNGPVIIGQMVGCPVEIDLLHDQQWMVISWSWQQLLFTERGGCAIFTAHRLATHPQPTPRSDGVELSYGRLVRNCCVMPHCLLSVFLTLCHLDLAWCGGQQPQGQCDKASAMLLFSHRSPLREW